MNAIIHPTVMLKKKFIDENKIEYNEDYICSQDYELWTRLANENNIAEIRKIGLLYRIHEGQVSNKKQELQRYLKERAIRENNIKKIKNDNKTFETLLFLSGNKKITTSNDETFIEDVKYIIKNNTKYDKKLFKKVIYTRILQIIIANPEIGKHMLETLKNQKLWKMIFTTNNLKYIFCKILKRIRVIFCKLRYRNDIKYAK